jgi:two-component system response regulator AlgR
MPETDPLRVLIADDEPLAAERLQLLLARAEGAQLVGVERSGQVDCAVPVARGADQLGALGASKQ